LANAKTLSEANIVLDKVLEEFNKYFSVDPRESGDLHRAVSRKVNLNKIFSIETPKPLRNDNTLVHNTRWFQVLTPTKAKKVILQERVNGQMYVLSDGKQLKYKAIPGPIKRVYQPRARLTTRRTVHPKDHPWRRAITRQCVEKTKNRTFLLC